MTREAKRRAPSFGYGTDAKSAFRSFAWDEISGRSPWREPGQQVMLLPSIEGLEIEEAIRRGFRESDIHIVDDNPAIVATLRRRYPNIHTYGVSVHRAHRRAAERGIRLYGASLDFCGPASMRLARELSVCSESDCWQSGARIVVNVLRGREDALTRRGVIADPAVRKVPWFKMLLDAWDCSTEIDPTFRDVWRAWLLVASMPRHIAVPRAVRPYLSPNGQSFLTCSFAVYRNADVRDGVTAQRGGAGCRAAWAQRAARAMACDFAHANAISNILSRDVDESGAMPQWVLNACKRRGDESRGAFGAMSPAVMAEIERFGKKYGDVFRGVRAMEVAAP